MVGTQQTCFHSVIPNIMGSPFFLLASFLTILDNMLAPVVVALPRMCVWGSDVCRDRCIPAVLLQNKWGGIQCCFNQIASNLFPGILSWLKGTLWCRWLMHKRHFAVHGWWANSNPLCVSLLLMHKLVIFIEYSRRNQVGYNWRCTGCSCTISLSHLLLIRML